MTQTEKYLSKISGYSASELREELRRACRDSQRYPANPYWKWVVAIVEPRLEMLEALQRLGLGEADRPVAYFCCDYGDCTTQVTSGGELCEHNRSYATPEAA
jgi:hypothetical protein